MSSCASAGGIGLFGAERVTSAGSGGVPVTSQIWLLSDAILLVTCEVALATIVLIATSTAIMATATMATAAAMATVILDSRGCFQTD